MLLGRSSLPFEVFPILGYHNFCFPFEDDSLIRPSTHKPVVRTPLARKAVMSKLEFFMMRLLPFSFRKIILQFRHLFGLSAGPWTLALLCVNQMLMLRGNPNVMFIFGINGNVYFDMGSRGPFGGGPLVTQVISAILWLFDGYLRIFIKQILDSRKTIKLTFSKKYNMSYKSM